MKKIILISLLFATIRIAASEPLKLGVITDMHYLSEQLMDKGYAVNDFVYNSGKNVIVVPEVLDLVIDDYLNSDIEVLLVTGDLTKDGEKQSHLDFKNKLKPLHAKGVKIFVIPGNHDINMPNSLKYQGNKTFKTENIGPKEFEQIYSDYGFNNAIDRDPNSLSYVAELNTSTWLLAIDAARYQEYKDHPITAGRVKSETEVWMLQALAKAKADNKQVIAMMHWGAVEHIPYQATVFKDYLVEDNKRIASLLADNGVKVVFTGHFHSNDISQFESENGNKIYDIETGALVSYPFAYRYIELEKGQMKVNTKNITSTPNYPNLEQENKDMMKRIAKARALPMIKKMGFQFPKQQIEQISDIAGDLFVLHLYGDEKIDDSLRKSLIDIFVEMGFPVDESMTNLDFDLPPADNNTTLIFD